MSLPLAIAGNGMTALRAPAERGLRKQAAA